MYLYYTCTFWQILYPLEYIVGPKASKTSSSNAKPNGSSLSKKQASQKLVTGTSAGSLTTPSSGQSNQEYAKAMKDFKLQWLRLGQLCVGIIHVVLYVI